MEVNIENRNNHTLLSMIDDSDKEEDTKDNSNIPYIDYPGNIQRISMSVDTVVKIYLFNRRVAEYMLELGIKQL